MKFCEEESNEVWVADEWDRSPAEVTPRLNYRSVCFLILPFSLFGIASFPLFCAMGSCALARGAG